MELGLSSQGGSHSRRSLGKHSRGGFWASFGAKPFGLIPLFEKNFWDYEFLNI